MATEGELKVLFFPLLNFLFSTAYTKGHFTRMHILFIEYKYHTTQKTTKLIIRPMNLVYQFFYIVLLRRQYQVMNGIRIIYFS